VSPLCIAFAAVIPAFAIDDAAEASPELTVFTAVSTVEFPEFAGGIVTVTTVVIKSGCKLNLPPDIMNRRIVLPKISSAIF
jgi:hypothetical protein